MLSSRLPFTIYFIFNAVWAGWGVITIVDRCNSWILFNWLKLKCRTTIRRRRLLQNINEKKNPTPLGRRRPSTAAQKFQSTFTSKCPPSKNDILLQGRKCEGIQKLISERRWQLVKYYVWNLVQQHIKTENKVLNLK